MIAPEVGAYQANLAAAGALWHHGWRDRDAATRLTDLGEGRFVWLLARGENLTRDSGAGQLSLKMQARSFLLGGDLAAGSWSGTDAYRFGLMVGYGEQSGLMHNRLTGYRALGEVEGGMVGLYGTWLQDAARHTGWFADGWMAYSELDASVGGEGLGTENYDIRSHMLSLETGYTTGVAALGQGEVWFEPQAQLVWSRNRMDRVGAAYGVYSGRGSNLTSRLGLRASWRPDAADKSGYLFAQGDWLHDIARGSGGLGVRDAVLEPGQLPVRGRRRVALRQRCRAARADRHQLRQRHRQFGARLAGPEHQVLNQAPPARHRAGGRIPGERVEFMIDVAREIERLLALNTGEVTQKTPILDVANASGPVPLTCPCPAILQR